MSWEGNNLDEFVNLIYTQPILLGLASYYDLQKIPPILGLRVISLCRPKFLIWNFSSAAQTMAMAASAATSSLHFLSFAAAPQLSFSPGRRRLGFFESHKLVVNPPPLSSTHCRPSPPRLLTVQSKFTTRREDRTARHSRIRKKVISDSILRLLPPCLIEYNTYLLGWLVSWCIMNERTNPLLPFALLCPLEL